MANLDLIGSSPKFRAVLTDVEELHRSTPLS